HWYVVVVDGTVQEKCRSGFESDGKTATNGARYRYVLQAMLLGPGGRAFPLIHEFVDMHDPVADKEDCELKAFARLSRRIKQEFPRLPICLVGDALYACEPVLRICRQNQWKYVLTLKEGRQPTTWSELLQLLPLNRANRLRFRTGPAGQQGTQDFRWVEKIMLGKLETNAILLGEVTPKTATLYAYVTNFAHLTPDRVQSIVLEAGRKRPLIEDTFHTEKHHGIGLEHVFCANTNAAKNYFTMMQVAQILWNLLCYGCLKRLYQWARDATAQGLARAIWDALRAYRLPPDLPLLGQIRFCSD
ncbi:MAG: transposase, partial [Bdellovibrionota bacterium]